MDVQQFEFKVNIDVEKDYSLVELGRGLHKLQNNELKRISDIGYFSFYGRSQDSFISSYLFIEKTLHEKAFKELKKQFSYTYPSFIGYEKGIKLQSMFDRIQENIKKNLIEDKEEDQLYRVTQGEYENLIVELKKYSPTKSNCNAFLYNKDFPIQIESKYLEKSDVDPAIFRFSQNFVRENVLENSNKFFLLDCTYMAIWSIQNHPNLFSVDLNKYVGICYGFYFTLLKLKQRFPDYKFICFFGKESDISDYYLKMKEFKSYNFTNKPELLPIIKDNLEWCLELCNQLGYVIYDSTHISTREMIATYATKLRMNPEIIIYSRDSNLFKFAASNISFYLNKISINGFDYINTVNDICAEYEIKDISYIDYVRALTGDDIPGATSIKQNLFKYIKDLSYKSDLLTALNDSKTNSTIRAFIENDLVKNLELFKINTNWLIPDFHKIHKAPNKQRVYNHLCKNSFYREASIIELTFPTLISHI